MKSVEDLDIKKLVKLFIAIPIDEQQCLEWRQRLQRQLAKSNDKLNWTRQGQQHITVVFLGMVATKHIDAIKQIMQQQSHKQPAFTVELDRIDYFPTAHSPLLACHVQLNTQLIDLFGRLKQSLLALGLEIEQRPYRPHITLARIKKKTRQTISPVSLSGEKIELNQLVLYQSLSDHQGSCYKKLYTVVL